MKITLRDIDADDNIPANVRMMPEGAMFVLKTPVRFVVRDGALVNLDEIVLECTETPSREGER